MKIRIIKENEDQTVTTPVQSDSDSESTKDESIEFLKSKGYEITKLLGKGMYGKVYAAFDPDDKEVAIKIVSPSTQGGDVAVDRELSNYWTIQKAREKSPIVAKHFPEVYEKPFKHNGYGFIIMEMLTSGGDEALEIGDLFGGAEGVIPAHLDLIAHGAYKDLSRRLFAFFDDTARRSAFVDNLFKGLDIDNIQDEPTREMLQKVRSKMKEFADYWRGIYDAVKDEDMKQEYMRQVAKLENVIPPAHQSYIMDFDTKKELTDNLWLYYLFLKMMEMFKKTDEYVYESYVGTITENFINLIRRASPIPIHNKPGRRRAKGAGAPEEMAGVSEQARSLLNAIAEAEKITGLAARDVHDKNAMFRPLGGDIVIVDLGLFKPRSQVRETIKKVGSKYVVYPKKGGKRLGTHDTKEDAKKQLAAIEISKRNESMEEQELEEKKRKKRKVKKKKGKRDACYYKVKRRYKVWPSAYASGALVKCRKVGAKNWGKSKKNENLEIDEQFQPHDMYDPETGRKERATKEQDHIDLALKGYTHVDPDKIEKVLDDEGGAAGVDAIVKGTDASEEEVLDTLEKMPDVGEHEEGDFIKDDDKEIEIKKEEMTPKRKIKIKIRKKVKEAI
jgi:serine/threonine protein kinase